MPGYYQCFICREWSHMVQRCHDKVDLGYLCLPCYVDVLEVRQNRGGLGGGKAEPAELGFREGPDMSVPPPFRQLDLFNRDQSD